MGSFVWEIFEFVFLKLLPQYAVASKLYSPTIFDLFHDLFFGFLGGIVAVMFLPYVAPR